MKHFVRHLTVRARLFLTSFSLILLVVAIATVLLIKDISTWSLEEGRVELEKVITQVKMIAQNQCQAFNANSTQFQQCLNDRLDAFFQIKQLSLIPDDATVNAQNLTQKLSQSSNPLLAPIQIELQVAGKAKVYHLISEQNHQQRIDDLKGFIYHRISLALGIAIVISLISAHLSSLTLDRLVRLANELAQGQSDHNFSMQREDEYGKLARSLNQISEHLEGLVSKLAESRDRFEAVLDAMQEAVIALDDRQHITLANQSAYKLFAWEESPIGKHVSAFIKDKALLQFVQEKLALEAPWVEMELEQGRTLLVRLTLQALNNEEVLVLNDITELRRLETVRKDFVANVSHELRTPISIIKLNVENLIDDPDLDLEMTRKFLQTIDRNTTRLNNLVSDLLDLSKLESGNYQLHLKHIPLLDETQRIVESLADQALEKEIEIQLDMPKNLKILSDLRALEQMMINLIVNAIKYTPNQGKIKIRASAEQQEIKVEIEDNGIGIAPEHQKRLFERFYRVDLGRSRQQGGTGLGLSIVKHLCVAMNGQVGVTSEAGRGSIFWFKLKNADHV